MDLYLLMGFSCIDDFLDWLEDLIPLIDIGSEG